MLIANAGTLVAVRVEMSLAIACSLHILADRLRRQSSWMMRVFCRNPRPSTPYLTVPQGAERGHHLMEGGRFRAAAPEQGHLAETVVVR